MLAKSHEITLTRESEWVSERALLGTAPYAGKNEEDDAFDMIVGGRCFWGGGCSWRRWWFWGGGCLWSGWCFWHDCGGFGDWCVLVGALIAGENEEDDAFDMIVGALEDIMMDHEFQVDTVVGLFWYCSRSLLMLWWTMNSRSSDRDLFCVTGPVYSD